MRREKSCGAVLYTRGPDRKYLLIQNRQRNIGFPKGHVQEGEDEVDTALREIREETGLAVELIDGFREQYDYRLPPNTLKTGVYFLASFDPEDEPDLPEDEISGAWLLPWKKARRKLSHANDRIIIDRAEAWLSGRRGRE